MLGWSRRPQNWSHAYQQALLPLMSSQKSKAGPAHLLLTAFPVPLLAWGQGLWDLNGGAGLCPSQKSPGHEGHLLPFFPNGPDGSDLKT